MTLRFTIFCLAVETAALCWGCGADVPDDASSISEQPNITPDYSDIVLPPNIAPLNFAVDEDGDDFTVRIFGQFGEPIVVRAGDGKVRIPEKEWKTLLRRNRGKQLSVEVYVLRRDMWHKFKALENRIAEEEIDSHVVYRWMRSLHHFYERFYLIQRSLESFQESTVLDNKSIGGGCMNCHSFLNGRTDTMTYQIRSSEFGLPMMLVKDGNVTPVNTRSAGFSASPAAFTSWHPSGKFIAFSVNKVSPYEHTTGQTPGEWDDDSDLAVYHVDENRVFSTSGISDPDRRESFPAWSADGKSLFFSSAPQMPFSEYQKVQYDLLKIRFDRTDESWGTPQVVVSSAQANMSCVEPRVSPDNKWVVFAGCEYGHMACFAKNCDLYVLNTHTGEYRRLAINSDPNESWPSWSSNGRWISFVSKRRDGLFSHIYFSYFDKDGKAHKPFILPQEDPRYYDSCARTYNRPELALEPIRITGSSLARGICSPEGKLEPAETFDREDQTDRMKPPNQRKWKPAGEKRRSAH